MRDTDHISGLHICFCSVFANYCAVVGENSRRGLEVITIVDQSLWLEETFLEG